MPRRSRRDAQRDRCVDRRRVRSPRSRRGCAARRAAWRCRRAACRPGRVDVGDDAAGACVLDQRRLRVRSRRRRTASRRPAADGSTGSWPRLEAGQAQEVAAPAAPSGCACRAMISRNRARLLGFRRASSCSAST
ncbi:MAG: hypothetical protein MZV64_42280 [Ignavibacteriales bacterium]|nr:hypothetical protein [Ignavibacteriales bacterium]